MGLPRGVIKKYYAVGSRYVETSGKASGEGVVDGFSIGDNDERFVDGFLSKPPARPLAKESSMGSL